MLPAPTLIFQSAKLGDIPQILDELEWARTLLELPPGRIFGVSGGNLVALAFGLARAARLNPQVWGKGQAALDDLAGFLRAARSRDLRAPNLNPWYGFNNLKPLRRWWAGRLHAYTGRSDWRLSQLGLPLYLCAYDHEALFTLFGPPDETLQCPYPFVHLGPPQDAPLLDALLASLSTLISTESVLVNGHWYFDCRPAVSDAGALVASLEAADPRPILRRAPHTPLRTWSLNWFTSSFVMHSQWERNQHLLAEYSLDLLTRHQRLARDLAASGAAAPHTPPANPSPTLGHVDLPYVGSTEAITNMRDSVANRHALLARFRQLLDGQLDAFPFDQPANVIYGAGGFSGILAGLTATRAVDAGFQRGGGAIRQVYGVSAGVLNGFFHAVKLAAERSPDRYTPAAHHALADLEAFMANCEIKRIARLNFNPLRTWIGWGNLEPLADFLCERLRAYTGAAHPQDLTFDDLELPMTVVVARRDGFSDFLGMTAPDRRFHLAGQEWRVLPAPIVQAILAGWSMNTYLEPTWVNGQQYTDGGGTFYDPALFVAMLDPELINLLNIHLDEPDGHSYHLPEHLNLQRILFDTQNLTFPEERRRMRALTDLLFAHFRLRGQALDPGPDFRREWRLPPPSPVRSFTPLIPVSPSEAL